MQTIPNRCIRMLHVAAAMFALAAFARSAQADIFQWEYINPADPTQGKRQSTTLAPDGGGVDALPGADWSQRNLTKAYLEGAVLTNVYGIYVNLMEAELCNANLTAAFFGGGRLTDASLSGAEIRGVDFSKLRIVDPESLQLIVYGSGITLDQIYSTASYREHDLSGIGLANNSFSGANFIDQNLANANFSGAKLAGGFNRADLSGANFSRAYLAGANFTDADVRGASFHRGYCPSLCPNFSPGSGIALAQLYSTASYQGHDLRGIDLSNNDLSCADFTGQNLAKSNFMAADLTNADFTGSDIRGASFAPIVFTFVGPDIRRGTITLAQLYSTASYRNRDLSDVSFGVQAFTGGNFIGQKMTNANRQYITFSASDFTDFTGADLSSADARGATGLNYLNATTTNLILPDGRIDGLTLNAGGLLVIRDYDGWPGDTFSNSSPISITVVKHLLMSRGGTLRTVFEANAWNSNISFAPGIPVTLGGTLELTFAGDVDLVSQLGRAFDLFDWTGVNPTGEFTISSPYTWDLSDLYTTGEVTLVSVPEPASALLIAAGFGVFFLHRRWRSFRRFLMLEIPSPIHLGVKS
jgi:uncharacterized protein YjbI with pentapeptide repeats